MKLSKLTKAALLTLYLGDALPTADGKKTPCQIITVINDEVIGVTLPPEIPPLVTVKADVYACVPSKGRRRSPSQSPPPLLIFLCGAPAYKANYTMFGQAMAKEGYVVVIPDHLVSFGPDEFNLANPYDIQRIIDYAKNQQQFEVGLDDVVLFGHSYGGSIGLMAMSEFCLPPLCMPPGEGEPPQFVQLPPEVKLGGGYGFTIFTEAFGPSIPLPSLSNVVSSRAGKPVPVINMHGEGENSTIEVWPGQPPLLKTGTKVMLTHENLVGPKTTIIGENLDHDSIANAAFSDLTWKPSTLSQEEQVEILVKVFAKWLKQQETPATVNICKVLDHGAVDILEENGVTMCFHEEEGI